MKTEVIFIISLQLIISTGLRTMKAAQQMFAPGFTKTVQVVTV